MTPEATPKRLNLRLSPEVDKILRDIAAQTDLKLVTIISKGIKLVKASLPPR